MSDPGSTAPGVRRRLPVLGTPIDTLDLDEALRRLAAWAGARESRYACLCNVHSVVTATRDPAFARALREADLAAPDGEPVAWLLRRLGATGQHRVSGPDLMLAYCEQAQARGEALFLLGSTPATLEALQRWLRQRWPALRIVGAESPPFRAPTPEEEAALAVRINASGAATVWVGLGCPKQELWMARQRGRVQAVMLGVGAAFDFHAGTAKRAPRWMREHGLEWLHRLLSEPRRLSGRYLSTNTAFLLGVARQLWRRPPPGGR